MSNEQHNTGLRASVRIPVSTAEETEQATLRPAVNVSQANFDSGTQQPAPEPEQRDSRPGKLFWFLVLLFLMAALQAGVSLYVQFRAGAWLGVAWLSLLVFAGVTMGVLLFREWRAFSRLEQRRNWQHESERLANSPAIGEAREYCLQLASQLPETAQKQVLVWQGKLEEHYSDKEIMTLFEQQVLNKIDNEVIHHISRESSASAVLIAVSPFALLDMLLVLWRNLKMINQVSRCYGIHTGYWARIKLIRKMCHNILYAGASELAADASSWALGGSLTARLSSRVAQGLGAGVLTARMGVQAVRLCRPMPFIHTTAPNTGQIASQILGRLKKVDAERSDGSE